MSIHVICIVKSFIILKLQLQKTAASSTVSFALVHKVNLFPKCKTGHANVPVTVPRHSQGILVFEMRG
jgi:hypothetical protein